MSKKITIQFLVHQFAREQAKKLKLGNYEEDLTLFEKLNPTRDVKTATFKYYMREMTDPSFSKYKGGSIGQNIITQATTKEKEEIKLFSLSKYNPDPKLFIPLQTGKPIDLMISKVGGFMPGTTIMFDGGPGTGKTTSGTDSLVFIKRKHPKKKCLYLNSEMKPLDLAAERFERPSLNEINDIFLLAEYQNAKKAIEEVLMMGWDFVLADSFDHICRRLKAQGARNPEAFILDLMAKHNDDAFETGHHTTFLVIQQVTKGGDFKGTNNQKHDTTAFIHAEFDDEGKRYLWAEKNRRNGRDVNRRLYYSLVDGDVVYDLVRWTKDQTLDQRAEDEKNNMKKEDEVFNLMFSKDNKLKNPNPKKPKKSKKKVAEEAEEKA